MHDPLNEAVLFLDSVWDDPDVIDPAVTSRGTSWPTTLAAGRLFIQYAWDGSATDADNVEDAAVRMTVWADKKNPSAAVALAGLLRPRFLLWSSATCWRVNRGPGRLRDVDPATQLPFCSFTARPQMRVDEPASP